MTERHKDIVRRLRAINDPEPICALEMVGLYQYELVVISEGEGLGHVNTFNLADLLAIVRGVDIDSDKQSELREMARLTVGEDISAIEGDDDD